MDELAQTIRGSSTVGPRVVSDSASQITGPKVAPAIIKERIEGIIERTGIPMPTIRIQRETHEIDVPDIKIEAPVPVAAPKVCEAKLVKMPDMVKIDTDFDFEFSVKNCGDAPGDFEVVVVISKTGAAQMVRCLDEPQSQPVTWPEKPEGTPSGPTTTEPVTWPEKPEGTPTGPTTTEPPLCGPGMTFPMFKTILWGVMPGETKQATITCRVGKEYTGRANINVRAWARLTSPPQPG